MQKFKRKTVQWKWGDLDSELSFENFGDGYSKYPIHVNDQIEAILKLTGLNPPLNLLDVGCGFGNQSIAFAKLGCNVTGIDLSNRSIEKAIANAQKQEVKIHFKAINAAEFNTIEKFNLAIALWHTLGFMSSDELNKHFSGIGNSLYAGGFFFLHLADCSGASPELASVKNWKETENSFVMSERYSEGTFRIETCIELVA